MRDVRGWIQAAIAVCAAAVLLGAATASGPFFVASAGTAMLSDELGASHDALNMITVTTGGPLGDLELRDADASLRDLLDERDLPAPIEQLVVQLSTTDGVGINLIARGGGALQDLTGVEDAGDDGVVVDAMNAARLGVEVGDEVVLEDDAGNAVTVTVADTVAAFDRQDMPSAWRPASGLLTVVDDPRFPPPPPAMLTHPDHVSELLRDLGASRGEGQAGTALVGASWSVEAVQDGLTLDQAQQLVPRLVEVRHELADPTSEAGSAFAAPGFGAPVIGGGELDAAVQRATVAAEELAVPVRLLGLAGQALALGAVAAAVVIGGRRRLSRSRLWTVRGVAPTTLGLRSAAACAIPLAAGVGLGWWGADLLVRALGPSGRLDAGVRAGVWPELAASWAIAILLVGAVTTIAVRVHTRATAAPYRVPPVAEAAAVVLAGIALWQADARGGVVSVAPDGTLRLDPLAVALPLVLVVAAAAAGVRLLGPLFRATGRTGGGRAGWYLASRRLRSFGGATMGLTFLTAAAVGLFVLATTLHASSEATIEEKVGLTAGADAVLSLSRSTVTERPDPASFPLPATLVRRAPEAQLGDDTVEVLAIDPATFADVAYRPRYLADVDVAGLTARLAGAPDGAPLPAIAVGAVPTGTLGSVRIGAVEVPVERVGTASVFPGVSNEFPTLVVPDGGPLAPDDPAVTARLAIAVFPELWVARGRLDDPAFRARLSEVELPGTGTGPGSSGPLEFTYTADLRDDPRVASAAWTFTYLRGQATIVAALGLLGLLGHHVARQRHQALGTSFAVRMGMKRRSRTVAELLEVGVLTAATLSLGGLAGIAAARTVVARYDPVPDIALPVVFQVPLNTLPAPLMIVAAAVGATVVITMAAVDRLPVATLLRSDA